MQFQTGLISLPFIRGGGGEALFLPARRILLWTQQGCVRTTLETRPGAWAPQPRRCPETEGIREEQKFLRGDAKNILPPLFWGAAAPGDANDNPLGLRRARAAKLLSHWTHRGRVPPYSGALFPTLRYSRQVGGEAPGFFEGREGESLLLFFFRGGRRASKVVDALGIPNILCRERFLPPPNSFPSPIQNWTSVLLSPPFFPPFCVASFPNI